MSLQATMKIPDGKPLVRVSPSVPPDGPPAVTLTQFHDAARDGDLLLLRSAIQQGVAIDSADEYGRTALHRAAANRRPLVVETLIRARANVNTKSHGGWTPLHTASFYHAGRDVVTLLLNADANILARDNDGCTVLHYLAPSQSYPSESDRASMATFFLEQGAYACLTIKTISAGETPYDVAMHCQRTKLASLFSDALKTPSKFDRPPRVPASASSFMHQERKVKSEGVATAPSTRAQPSSVTAVTSLSTLLRSDKATSPPSSSPPNTTLNPFARENPSPVTPSSGSTTTEMSEDIGIKEGDLPSPTPSSTTPTRSTRRLRSAFHENNEEKDIVSVKLEPVDNEALTTDLIDEEPSSLRRSSRQRLRTVDASDKPANKRRKDEEELVALKRQVQQLQLQLLSFMQANYVLQVELTSVKARTQTESQTLLQSNTDMEQEIKELREANDELQKRLDSLTEQSRSSELSHGHSKPGRQPRLYQKRSFSRMD